MADETTPAIPLPQPTSVHIDTEPQLPSIPIPTEEPAYDPAKDSRAEFLKVKPNTKEPTIEAAHKPITQRIKEAITENIPQFSTRTVENPNYGKESFLPDSETLTQEERKNAPMLAGAMDVASELASPATIGTVAATAGIGEAGVIPKVLSGLFAGQIAASVYDQYPALKDAVNKAQTAKTQQEHDDAFSDAQRILTHMGADTVMGLLAAKHGAEGAQEILDKTTGSGVPDQASTFKNPNPKPGAAPEETHPEMNRETVKALQKLGYSNQEITNFNIAEIRDILKGNTSAAERKVVEPEKLAPAQQQKLGAAPEPDKFAAQGGKLVGTKAESIGKPAAAPEEPPFESAEPLEEPERIAQLQKQAASPNSLESKAAVQILQHVYGETPDQVESLIMSDKIGGKKVKGATPKVEPTILAQRVPEALKGLVERTTGDEQADAAIKSAGAIPAGTGLGLAMFHDPKTGSTLALKPEDVTPERIQQHLAASRQAYGIKPEPEAFASVGGKLVQKPQPAEESTYHPDLQKVADQNGGIHTDASKLTAFGEPASFITPDGKFINLRTTHDEAIEEANPARRQPKDLGGEGQVEGPLDNRVGFIDDTGAVRMRMRSTKAGKILSVTVPAQGVSPEQMDALRQTVGTMRNGNLIIERSDINADNEDTASKIKEFVRPSDVEGMLREIGAHPDQQDIVSKELQTPHKETYGMEVTDAEGKVQKVPVDAHSPKQALATVIKKFPEAHEWRLDTMPEEQAPSTEYSVPTGKRIKMPSSYNRPEEDTEAHEVAHALVALQSGLQTGGVLSSHHPSVPSDARAVHLLKGAGLRDPRTGQILADKRTAVLASGLAGIASDELRGVHRAANPNFDLRESGDGAQAYQILKAAGFTHEDALTEMHRLIDENIQTLKHPAYASVVNENLGFREKGLSRQFHYSPERLQNMHAEIERRKANGESTGLNNGPSDAATAEGRSGDVAGGKGGISRPSTEGEPAETEEGIVSEEKVKKPKAPQPVQNAYDAGKLTPTTKAAKMMADKKGFKVTHKQQSAALDMTNPDDAYNAARHEASHAVASELLQPGSVQTMALSDDGGKTVTRAPAGVNDPKQLNHSQLIDMLTVSLAGGLGEPGGANLHGSAADAKNRLDLMKSHGGIDQGAELTAEALARHNALMADPRTHQLVDTLATKLAGKKSLTGDEVRATIKAK